MRFAADGRTDPDTENGHYENIYIDNAECYGEHCVLKKSGHTEAVRPFGGCLSLFLAPASTHLLGSKSSSLVGLCTKKGSL